MSLQNNGFPRWVNTFGRVFFYIIMIRPTVDKLDAVTNNNMFNIFMLFVAVMKVGVNNVKIVIDYWRGEHQSCSCVYTKQLLGA